MTSEGGLEQILGDDSNNGAQYEEQNGVLVPRREFLTGLGSLAVAGAAGSAMLLDSSEAEAKTFNQISRNFRNYEFGTVKKYGRKHTRVRMPRDAFPIISDYGDNTGVDGSRRTLNGGFHNGIDIGAPRGVPVIAAEDGTVFWSRYKSLDGNVVSIEHYRDNRLTPMLISLYSHLDERKVSPGQKVKRGDVIGTVGSTGRGGAGVNHLHFSLWHWMGGRSYRNRNPHDLWYRGRNRVTLMNPNARYGQSNLPSNPRLTYPVPGRNHVNHFMSKMS